MKLFNYEYKFVLQFLKIDKLRHLALSQYCKKNMFDYIINFDVLLSLYAKTVNSEKSNPLYCTD